MDYLFYGCTNLTEINLRSFNTENVESFSNTFGQCSKDLKVYIKSEHNSNFIEKFSDTITIIKE
jgi:surface protein